MGGISTATIGPGNSSQPSPNWCVGWLNTTNTFSGNILSDGNSSVTKVGTGTWYLSGQNSYVGSTTISNGVLELTNNVDTGADGNISASTNIFINAGAYLDVSGRTDDTMPLNYGQVISGYGTIRGILDTTAQGTVSPGGGITGGVGVLTVTSSVNLGGTAWMKLNRASSPTSDRLVSATSITYGGTLLVTNIGPRLQVGDTFTLFSAPVLNNSFSLALPDYYTWDTSMLTVNGSVKVTGVQAAPAISRTDFSQLANGYITLYATNGTPSGPLTVLTTTNLTLPLANWATVGSGNFDGSGNYNVQVSVDPTVPQQYFILEAQ